MEQEYITVRRPADDEARLIAKHRRDIKRLLGRSARAELSGGHQNGRVGVRRRRFKRPAAMLTELAIGG